MQKALGTLQLWQPPRFYWLSFLSGFTRKIKAKGSKDHLLYTTKLVSWWIFKCHLNILQLLFSPLQYCTRVIAMSDFVLWDIFGVMGHNYVMVRSVRPYFLNFSGSDQYSLFPTICPPHSWKQLTGFDYCVFALLLRNGLSIHGTGFLIIWICFVFKHLDTVSSTADRINLCHVPLSFFFSFLDGENTWIPINCDLYVF